VGAGSPGCRSGSRGTIEDLSLHKHWYNGAGAEAKGAVAKHAKDGGNLAGVARNGENNTVVRRKYLVQNGLGTQILGGGCFSCDAVPELVIFRKAWLDLEGWIRVLNISFVAAMIASVDADAFSQIFLDGGGEWLLPWEIQARESKLSGCKTPGQGADVVRIRRGDFLHRDLMGPEVVGNLRLVHAVGGQMRIHPAGGRIAVQFGPVAVPGGSAIVGFSGIVPALAVATQEKKLILDILAAFLVQAKDLTSKLLPLGQTATARIALVLARIRLVDQTKVDGGLFSGSGKLGFRSRDIFRRRDISHSQRMRGRLSSHPAKSTLSRSSTQCGTLGAGMRPQAVCKTRGRRASAAQRFVEPLLRRRKSPCRQQLVYVPGLPF
jgi:hypothetical protein